MAGKFRWFVARLVQLPSGVWSVDPAVKQPNALHCRYFFPLTREDIALIRMHHATPAEMTTYITALRAVSTIRRIRLVDTWGVDLQPIPVVRQLVQDFGIALPSIKDTDTGSQIINRIGNKTKAFERIRPNARELPFLRDVVEE